MVASSKYGDPIRFGPLHLAPGDFWQADLLHIDYVLGVNQRVSALDIARCEVSAFQVSCADASQGWGHLDKLQFWVRPPWTPIPRVLVRFLERDTAALKVSLA